MQYDWNSLEEDLLEKFAEKFRDKLDGLDGKDYVTAYVNIIKFVRPTVQSQQRINKDEDRDFTIKVER